MTSPLLDLSAVALAGIALTGAVLSFAHPRAHMAPAGEPGLSIEMAFEAEAPMRTAANRVGGAPTKAEAPWAAVPHAF